MSDAPDPVQLLRELAERTAREALAIASQAGAKPVSVTVDGITVRIGPNGRWQARERRPLTNCERGLLVTLVESHPQRLRVGELHAAMTLARRLHPEKAVVAALKLLSREPYSLIDLTEAGYTATAAGLELAKLFVPTLPLILSAPTPQHEADHAETHRQTETPARTADETTAGNVPAASE